MYGPVCSGELNGHLCVCIPFNANAGTGIKSDVVKRFPLYLSDFQNTANLKVLASVLFMFFTSVGPAATFSALLQSKTDDQIGFVEVMVSTAVTGSLWSFISGQPLVILVSK